MLVARRVGGTTATAYILVNLAAVDRVEGDLARAQELIEESLGRFQQLADRQGEAFALNALGNLARSSGDFEHGRALLERSLALRQEIGDRRGTGITLGCLAVLLARSGDPAGRSGIGRAGSRLVRRKRRSDRPQRRRAEPDERGAVRRGSRRWPRASGGAASILGGMESTHQEGWALAVLAAMSAEDDEPAMARSWLDRASRHFELLGGEAGIAYCRETGV